MLYLTIYLAISAALVLLGAVVAAEQGRALYVSRLILLALFWPLGIVVFIGDERRARAARRKRQRRKR